MKLVLIFLAVFGLGISCTKRNLTASESLNAYLDMSFDEGQSREAHLERTAGVLQEQINAMSDEEFATYINREALNKKRFKVVLSNCNEEKCFITYTLSYDEGTKTSPNSTVEVRKIAELWFEDGSWKVADVNNVKTHIQNKHEIEISSEN